MSVKIMSLVWEDGPRKQGELLVMLALADWCNDAGECWPSMDAIAAKARLSDQRSARRIMRRLEAEGWVEISTGGGRYGCNKYTLKLGPKVPLTESPPRTVEPYPPGLSMPETRTVEPPEPSRTIIEPSDPPLTPHAVLSALIRPETATDFIAHRKAMKKPVTIEAARRLVAKARDHPDPDSVFDESIANGWQGIFPERKDGGRNGRRQDGSVAAMAERVGQRFAARQLDSRSSVNPSQPLLSAGPPD